MGKHRLTTGAIVRAVYARNTVVGYAGFPVQLGDTFTV